jgi:hypothetical protein
MLESPGLQWCAGGHLATNLNELAQIYLFTALVIVIGAALPIILSAVQHFFPAHPRWSHVLQ